MGDEPLPAYQIVEPGKTCATVAKADRARLLIDAADYYAALRQGLLNARRNITIVGWDIDGRTDLLPGQPGETGPEGAPTRLKPLLTHLVEERPDLKVRLLLWDYTILYAGDRQALPSLNLNWVTPPQVEVCLDDALPLGACHHQKLVVIDDSLAFCGGLDLTQRRWDTSEHLAGDTRRTDAAGQPYEPFHDCMMMVDGEAAAALARVVADRWHEATCARPVPVRPHGDPWPADVEPDLRDIPVAVARTLPQLYDRAEVREIEALYCRAVARAETAVYIENQYLTSDALMQALGDRMEAAPDLQVVVVGPQTPHGWLEAKSMGAGRLRFIRHLEERGLADRVRLLHPQTPGRDGGGDEAVMVHCKLMIVDDRLITLGSANLNNRSMGFDSECNLAVEARRQAERDVIGGYRARLLGEHLGVAPAEVDAAVARHGLVGAVDHLCRDAGRTLRPVDDGSLFDDSMAAMLHRLADRERPIDLGDLSLNQYQGQASASRRTKILAAAAVLLLAVGAVLLWSQTPLDRFTHVDNLKPYFQSIRDSSWTPLLVAAVYLVGGVLMFPVTVLVTLTAVVFTPLGALAYAGLGIAVSAGATYGLGAFAGRRFLRRIMGKRLNRVSRAIARRGVVAVVGLRVAPVAPYSLINMVAGASHIRFRDFALGTLIGMAPGVAVLVWLGESIWGFLSDPTPGQVGVLVAAVAAWVLLGFGLQRLLNHGSGRGRRRFWHRRRGGKDSPSDAAAAGGAAGAEA